jgi:flagellar motor switch protein FliM
VPEVISPPAPAEAPFDFRQSLQVSDAQIEAVRALFENFVRSLSESLSLTLRVGVTGTLAGLEQTTFGALAETISAPATILCFRVQPHAGYTLVSVSPSLVAPILDCMLGGNGKIVFALEREVTDLEQSMLEGFFAKVAQELGKAWQPVAPIDFHFTCVETTPQASGKIAAGDAVIQVAADLRIGENEGRLDVIVPALTLKSLRPKSESRSEARKSVSRDLEDAIRQKLADGLKLELDCALVGASIRLNDLLNLKPGDLIDTGIPCDGAATILVNGVSKFSGEVTVDGPVQSVVIRS